MINEKAVHFLARLENEYTHGESNPNRRNRNP